MATGTTLTFDQIQALWVQNGGKPGWAPLAAAIAIAESGGNTASLNNTPATGDYSVGLWQINYFGSLLPGRTQSYGSPAALQSDPNAQAKAAIQLSGNGTNWGPWKTDAAWNKWVANGSPSQPTKATIAAWGASLGGAGGGTSETATAAGAATGPGSGGQASGTGCNKPDPGKTDNKIFGIIGLSFSKCQAKSVLGGLSVGMGGMLAVTGVIIIVAWGLGHTSAGRGAMQAARVVPVVGRVARR
jgi:hypothetical protein